MGKLRLASILCVLALAAVAIGFSGCSDEKEDTGTTGPVGSGQIVVQFDPDTLQADWILAGPSDLRQRHTGGKQVSGLPAGNYTLVWQEYGDLVLPEPPVESATLDNGATVTFEGRYRLAPEASVTVAVEPAQLPARWELQDPYGRIFIGRGDSTITDLFDGNYTLRLYSPSGWQLAGDAELTVPVPPAEERTVTAVYQQVQDLVGFALAEDGGVWRTFDQGETWTLVGSLGGTGASAIAMPDVGILFAARTNQIMRSRDGGTSWDVSYAHDNPAVRFTDVCFGDWATGLAVANDKTIVGTRDCGGRWHERPQASAGHFKAVTMFGGGDDAISYAVGVRLVGVNNSFQIGASNHAFVPRFAADGSEPIFRTIGIVTFPGQNGAPDVEHDFSSETLWDVDWTLRQDGALDIVMCGTNATYAILRFRPGHDNLPGGGTHIEFTEGVEYRGSWGGWAVGTGGRVRSPGATGTVEFVTDANLHAIGSPDDGTVLVAVGATGTIVRSIDSGATWQETTVGTAATLVSVVFRDVTDF